MLVFNLIVFLGFGGSILAINAFGNYYPFGAVMVAGILWICFYESIRKYIAANFLANQSLAIPSAVAHNERRFRTYPSSVCNTWYHFVDSSDLKVGTVMEYRALGRVFVLWRGSDGKPVCQDAFCLHQGANLGLGGKVEDNCIVCPFHMWKFSGDGTIMEVPYLNDPTSCQSSARKQKTYHCVDWCGLLLVYFHADDKEPEFSPPDIFEVEHAKDKWEQHVKWDSGFFTFSPIDIVDQASDHMHFNTIHKDFMIPWTNIRLPEWLLRLVPLGISHTCVTYRGDEREWEQRVKETGWGVVNKHLLFFTDNAGLTWAGKMMEKTASLTMELFLGPAVYVLTIPFTIGTLRIFLTVTPTDGGSALRMRTWIDSRTANNFFIKTLAWVLTGISASQLNADVNIIENKIRLRKPMIQPYDGPYNRVNAWLKQFYSEGTKDIFDCKSYKNDCMIARAVAFALLALQIAFPLVTADDYDHTYKVDEVVSLWVNHIGPYHNPQETYPYYQLPYCKPDLGVDTKKKASGIGEALEGNELRNSGFKLHFATDVVREDVCDMKLDKETAAEFELAVDRQYWYELVLDDLPMWGMVGEVLRDETHGRMEKHIFTHRSLSISYSGNRIIEVNLTSENPVPIEAGQDLSFTYSVHWHETSKAFDTRFNRYLEYDFFEHKIHWFSVFNSFMMVIFLCGLVFLILLRTLRNDFARYAKDEDLDVEGMQVIGEDTGWKQVHGDVFRPPENLEFFCAIVGTGWQLVVLVLFVILYAMLGPYLHGNMYEDRGEMISTFIICFSLSSAIAGYSSGSYYRRFFPTARSELNSQWQKSMVYTILLFPGVVVTVISVLNSIAIYYDTISAIPASVIVKMVAIWAFVALPLAVVGTIFGRHWMGKYEPPCRVNSIPRPIPVGAWYTSPLFVIPAAGVLPFGSIFIEMYFIFTAFWSYKFYYVYGFMLLVYTILTLVTICTTIVAVYFILNAENYNWQWIALGSAGSTSFYVFLYSIFYFYYKTQMTGLLQVAYYFGYMALFCIGLFFMCGALGVWGANIFVHKIYRNVKID